MKYVLPAFWMIMMCGVAASEDAKISIGPWQIDASFTESESWTSA